MLAQVILFDYPDVFLYFSTKFYTFGLFLGLLFNMMFVELQISQLLQICVV